MLLNAVLALEALHPAGRIDQPLRAGVKGMAIRAHLDPDVGQRRMRLEGIAARASHHGAAVFWMDSSFHLTLYDRLHFALNNTIAHPVAQFTPRGSRGLPAFSTFCGISRVISLPPWVDGRRRKRNLSILSLARTGSLCGPMSIEDLYVGNVTD